MSDIANRKIQKFIRDNHLFWEIEEWDPIDDIDSEEHVDDFMYAEFYLMKKLSLNNELDLNKIRNSNTIKEYEKNVDDEMSKIKGLNSNYKEWFWNRFFKKRQKVFRFIDSLKIDEFDIHTESNLWLCDDYLRQFIDLKNTYYVLSIYTTFYDDEVSKNNSIDVLYNEFQNGNVIGSKARLDIINNKNYQFTMDSFPKTLNKKYDLIVFNLEYTSIGELDKTGLIKMDDDIGGIFAGDSVTYNISSIVDNLLPNGMAIIKTPFTFISKIDNDLIEQNIIDKIIYLPKTVEPFGHESTEVKNVYVIVKKNKQSNEIEFIDRESGESISVSNELIKKHKGCANMHIYTKHNPMLEKLYRIKEDNAIQLKAISKDTEMIDKQIDELDFD